MSATAAINTKIERVTEAISSMVVTTIAHQGHQGTPTAASFDNCMLARTELRDSLAEFLQPALRVVERSTK